MAVALIGLGSNLGDRDVQLARAVAELRATPGIDVRAASRWRITSPLGGPIGQAEFLNGAAVVDTSLSAEQLMERLLAIETGLGRVRSEPRGPRTVDLDLLLYDNVVRETATLTIPHPQLAWRRFALEPAAEIAPDLMHPTVGWTVRQLYDHALHAPEYIAIAGVDPETNRQLAEAVLAHEPGQLIAAPAFFTDEPAVSDLAEAALPRGVASRLYLQYGALPKRADAQAHGMSISDFWFDQFADWSAVHLAARWRPLYRQTFEELRADVLPAKLIVLLLPAETAGQTPYATHLRTLTTRSGVGPVLPIRIKSGSEDQVAANWESNVAEVVDAIRGMR